jgi:hypothetical protein
VTHDNDKPSATEPPAQDTALSLLTIATPAFRFSFLSAGFHRAIWPARRRKPSETGASTDVTPDQEELQENLGPATVPSDSNGVQPNPEHAGS